MSTILLNYPPTPSPELGSFQLDGYDIRVVGAGEHALWLYRSSQSGPEQVGVIRWNEVRTPHLTVGPDMMTWVSPGSRLADTLVSSAMRIFREEPVPSEQADFAPPLPKRVVDQDGADVAAPADTGEPFAPDVEEPTQQAEQADTTDPDTHELPHVADGLPYIEFPAAKGKRRPSPSPYPVARGTATVPANTASERP